MENLWSKANDFVLFSKVGDFYFVGENKISVIKRTPKRIYFSDGKLITIKKSKYNFYFFDGKQVNQILRDIEGYFIYLKHTQIFKS